jgi:hypothetical protein
MSLRTLSEAIILQSAEDLLSASHRREGLEFFSGEGFRLCSETAGMTFDEKLEFLHMLLGCIASGKKMSECTREMVGNKETKGWSHSHKGRKNALLNAL